ncbi:flagellar hook-length control protein FliK [Paucibacter sp. APW11]|uniref:Flagellar hook-length control protein FliK n=1 Tax=Roseateles aquae TaxID=3077235 RepID=A0ABU3PB68_9BURK|nr:flagellar hook-length control protein FliK [Paucibacter sp. APW11]MDT8999353.1 flagellar hook-length control protein FliK [Paucibacter sp. APW11]
MNKIATSPATLSSAVAGLAGTAGRAATASNAAAAGSASFMQLLRDSSQPAMPPAAPAPAPVPAAQTSTPTPQAAAPAPGRDARPAPGTEHNAEDGRHTMPARLPGNTPAKASSAEASKAAKAAGSAGDKSAATGSAKTSARGDADDAGTASTRCEDTGELTQDGDDNTTAASDAGQLAAQAAAGNPQAPAASAPGLLLAEQRPAASLARAGNNQDHMTAASESDDAEATQRLGAAPQSDSTPLMDKSSASPGSKPALAEQVLAIVSGRAEAGAKLGSSTGAAASEFAGALQAAQGASSAKLERSSAQGIAAPREYSIDAPLYSDDFAPQMSARLSLAAADGVQQALLNLNPAEMGPVQVQIVLDGQQAQISFVSDQPDTRAVLERSLPELAAALRDNGMTLSGGGVFSQSQQGQARQEGRNADAGSRAILGGGSRPDDSVQPLMAALPTPATRGSRGVLDLFA